MMNVCVYLHVYSSLFWLHRTWWIGCGHVCTRHFHPRIWRLSVRRRDVSFFETFSIMTRSCSPVTVSLMLSHVSVVEGGGDWSLMGAPVTCLMHVSALLFPIRRMRRINSIDQNQFGSSKPQRDSRPPLSSPSWRREREKNISLGAFSKASAVKDEQCVQ